MYMSLSFFSISARQLAFRSWDVLKPGFPVVASVLLHTTSRFYPSVPRSLIRHATRTGAKKPTIPGLLKMTGIAGIGLAIVSSNPRVHCDAPPQSPNKQSPEISPPPASTVSLFELSFGTVTGVCAGVFIKKGARAVAWFLGGIFVLLQYLGSESLVRVDWGRITARYEKILRGTDDGATKRARVVSLWSWMVDFLTADFQPRASFIAGLALGLRIG